MQNKKHIDETHRHLIRRIHMRQVLKSVFWFSVGACLGIFLFVSFVFIYFQHTYSQVVYPGIMIGGISMAGKTQADVEKFYATKNAQIQNSTFLFKAENEETSLSAKDLEIGYDEKLLAEQAYSVGRSTNILSNINLIFESYINGVNLSPSYRYSEEKLTLALEPMQKAINIEPVDALFQFENGRVSAFQPSSEGRGLEIKTAKNQLFSSMKSLLAAQTPQSIVIVIPITTLKPKITTDKANNLGIKELIGTGTSLFQGSIPERIHNVTLAASRINGVIIAPGEVFSFVNSLGDVSKFTGYKQAYVIENGHTVLGDGGGVCQVSTTFFRALLNGGLPIVSRTAHAYRVSYYEQGTSPGIDATVYVPSVDLKFKNDTQNSILIQTVLDPTELRLTVYLYGTLDGRSVEMSTPVIKNQTPAPEPLYQDDPSLPRGTVKQIDFAAAGANIEFTRIVKKNNQVYLSDKFVSNYRPWQAVFLRGTK